MARRNPVTRSLEALSLPLIIRDGTSLEITSYCGKTRAEAVRSKKPDPYHRDNIDRLGALPSELVHRIFSFLGPRDFVAMGAVSKRLRQPFISSPDLNFSHARKPFAWPAGPFDFLRKFFTLRERSLAIRRLHLKLYCWTDYDNIVDTLSPIDKWVHPASGFNVEELRIEVSDKLLPSLLEAESCGRNPWIFNCQTLKCLELCLNYDRLPLPSVCFCSLEVLSVSKVTTPKDGMDLGLWISTYCPVVKKLRLENIEGTPVFCLKSSILEDFLFSNVGSTCYSYRMQQGSASCFDISAKNLKVLVIRVEYHRYYVESPASATIDAPGLESLKWIGFAPKQCTFGGFRCLHNAILDLQTRAHTTPRDDGRDGGPMRPWILELINSTTTAQVLQISVLTIEHLFVQGHLPIAFPNLHRLGINVGIITDAQIPAIFSFLSGLPNVETVSMIYDVSTPEYHLKPSPMMFRESHEPDTSSGFTNFLCDRLREVEINFSGCSTVEVGIVKHLIEHGSGLEKMSIYCSGGHYDMLSEEMESFNRASSKLEIKLCYETLYDWNAYQSSYY